MPEAVICVIASQVANLGESFIGAALQEKEGFQWVGSLVILFSKLDSCFFLHSQKGHGGIATKNGPFRFSFMPLD